MTRLKIIRAQEAPPQGPFFTFNTDVTMAPVDGVWRFPITMTEEEVKQLIRTQAAYRSMERNRPPLNQGLPSRHRWARPGGR